jgi:hypothetical protein
MRLLLIVAALPLLPALLLPQRAVAEQADRVVIGAVQVVKGTVYRESGTAAAAAVAVGYRPVAAGDPVFVADTIVTGADGRARIHLNDGSLVTIGGDARLRLADYQGTGNGFTTKLYAVVGTVRLFVSKVIANGRFEVETETAAAAVRGTDFVVVSTADNTGVAILDGSVAVRGKSLPAEVILRQPGDGTDVARGQAPTEPKRWGAARLAAALRAASIDD